MHSLIGLWKSICFDVGVVVVVNVSLDLDIVISFSPRWYVVHLDGSVFEWRSFRSQNFWELSMRLSRFAVIHYSVFPGLYAVLRDFLIRPLFFKLEPLYKVDEGRQSRSLCLAGHRTHRQLLPRCSRRIFWDEMFTGELTFSLCLYSCAYSCSKLLYFS